MNTRNQRRLEDSTLKRRRTVQWEQKMAGAVIPLVIMKDLIESGITEADYKKVVNPNSKAETVVAIITGYLKGVDSEYLDAFDIVDNGTGEAVDHALVQQAVANEEIWKTLGTAERVWQDNIFPILTENNYALCFMYDFDNNMALKEKKISKSNKKSSYY